MIQQLSPRGTGSDCCQMIEEFVNTLFYIDVDETECSIYHIFYVELLSASLYI